eukprot:gene10434-11528_t
MSAAHRLLSTILDDVSALAEALNSEANESQPQLPNESVPSPTSVEKEVTSLFRGRVATTTTTPVTDLAPHPLPYASASPVAVPTFRQSAATTTNFNAVRKRPFPQKRGEKPQGRNAQKQQSGPFFLDVILLRSPNDDIVPKQQPKLDVMERGHIFHGVKFDKGWNAVEVDKKIRDLFSNLLGDDSGYEIATSVHTKIVKPTLDRDQQCDGPFIYRLFRTKTLYILPDHELFPTTPFFTNMEDSTSEEDDKVNNPKKAKLDIETMFIDSDPYGFPPCTSELVAAVTAVTNEDDKPAPQSQSFDSLSNHLTHLTPSAVERALLTKNIVVVRRRKLWEDAIKKVNLFYDAAGCTDNNTNIEVQFVGEEVVDGGGVRREFFCKLFEKSVEKIMKGAENQLTFKRDSQRLERNEYFCFGKAIALSFLNGCDGPHNWCKSLIEYILDPDDNKIQYQIEAIPDGIIRAAVMTLDATKDKESMENCSMKMFFLMQDSRLVLMQPKSSSERKHKIDAVGQFIYKQDHLSTKELIYLFTITYSSLDTAKEAEEDIVYNFTSFLDHVQKSPMEVEVLDYESILAMGEGAVNYADGGKLKRVQIKLEDVLQFLTGSKFVGSLNGMK